MGFFSDVIANLQGFRQVHAIEQQKQAYADSLAWRNEMFANGFASYEHTPPKRGVDLILIRYEWPEPIFRRREDLHATLNVNGLMWKAWTGKTIDGEINRPDAAFDVPSLARPDA